MLFFIKKRFFCTKLSIFVGKITNMSNTNNRAYLCLSQQTYTQGSYTLTPLRHHDQEAIRLWRNEQIAILRQKKPLTQHEQAVYYDTVVAKLFEVQQPNQLLFSFLLNNQLIGYGGLVHISWEDKNAEISFLLETSRNQNPDLFKHEWDIYLHLLRQIAFEQLQFKKIYTYAYDIRPNLIAMLLDNGFVQEARLRQHVCIENVFHDVLIHAVFNEPNK